MVVGLSGLHCSHWSGDGKPSEQVCPWA